MQSYSRRQIKQLSSTLFRVIPLKPGVKQLHSSVNQLPRYVSAKFNLAEIRTFETIHKRSKVELFGLEGQRPPYCLFSTFLHAKMGYK